MLFYLSRAGTKGSFSAKPFPSSLEPQLTILLLAFHKLPLEEVSSTTSRDVVKAFIDELIGRARYRIRGEKPLIVIAALKYSYDSNLYGKSLLNLLEDPTYGKGVRKVFLELATRFGRMKEPATSWSVVVGQKELQKAIRSASSVNESFAKLTPSDISALVTDFVEALSRHRPAKVAVEMKRFPIKELGRLRLVTFPFKGARTVLGDLCNELIEAVGRASSRSHSDIVKSLSDAGWSTEVSLLGQYRLDAFKDGIGVEVEATDKSSVIDVLHRDFFRFLMLYKKGEIRTGVLITSLMGGEVNLEKAKSDLDLYGDQLEVPLLIIGLR